MNLYCVANQRRDLEDEGIGEISGDLDGVFRDLGEQSMPLPERRMFRRAFPVEKSLRNAYQVRRGLGARRIGFGVPMSAEKFKMSLDLVSQYVSCSKNCLLVRYVEQGLRSINQNSIGNHETTRRYASFRKSTEKSRHQVEFPENSPAYQQLCQFAQSMKWSLAKAISVFILNGLRRDLEDIQAQRFPAGNPQTYQRVRFGYRPVYSLAS